MQASPLVVLGFVLGLPVCVHGQRQFEERPDKSYWAAEADVTAALAQVDVDGDGDLDLVVGNVVGQQNKLYVNEGSGGLVDATAARLPSDSDATCSLAAGDVDGDGDPDLVLGNGGQQNRLYLNDGAGTFTDATAFRMPVDAANTWAVLLRDVDGDSDLDILFANRHQQNRLYLNDGSGSFTDGTAPRLPADSDDTWALAAGDVDGDGDTDLLLGNIDFAQNRLYLNDGSGIFTDGTAGRMPVDVDHTHALVLGDVDGDGDLDLVVGNVPSAGGVEAQNRLYLNDGTGTFTDATAFKMPSDTDTTQTVALTDVDGDGDLDVVTGNGDFQAAQPDRLYLNDGTGSFIDATGGRIPPELHSTRALMVGDADGNGDPDLIIGTRTQNRLFLNDGSGAFSDPHVPRLPGDADDSRGIALGDVDLDGDLDIVFGNYRGQSRLYLNDGTGSFADATTGRLPLRTEDTWAPILVDVDGDGDLDLMLGNALMQNRLYRNSGAGVFVDVTAAGMPSESDYSLVLAPGDVDGDGDLDVLVGNWGQQNRLYLNDGAGTFIDATGEKLPVDSDDTYALALGDVDGDGDPDAVFGNAGQNRLFLNRGNGGFLDVTAAQLPVDGQTTRAVCLDDVDADGDLDLVIGNWWTQNRLYLNDGTGTFVDATAGKMPARGDRTWAMAMGDVDEDGDADLVVGNYSLQNRLYLNDGSGTFADVTANRLPLGNGFAWSVALGDVERDGDLDIVIGNSIETNRLYTNLHRQLSTPFHPTLSRPYSMVFHAKPGYATASHSGFAVLGFGLAPIPLPVPGVGMFFLDPGLLVSLSPVVIPRELATASRKITVPATASLVGAVPYLQGLIVDNTTGEARLTGHTADAIR